MSNGKRIFVSYRRDDDGAYLVPELKRKLTSRYGDGSVFYDIDNIPLGVDFRDYLSNAIASASIVLVVIGDRWAGYDAQTGLRRIDREDDFVRIEIESALSRGIPVVPVLVGHATMPCEKELPASISKLAYRNAAEIRTGRDYDLHMDALLRGLDAIMAAPQAARQSDTSARPQASSQENASPAALEIPSRNTTFDRFTNLLLERSLRRTQIWAGRRRNERGIKIGFSLKCTARS